MRRKRVCDYNPEIFSVPYLSLLVPSSKKKTERGWKKQLKYAAAAVDSFVCFFFVYIYFQFYTIVSLWLHTDARARLGVYDVNFFFIEISIRKE